MKVSDETLSSIVDELLALIKNVNIKVEACQRDIQDILNRVEEIEEVMDEKEGE